MDSAWEQEKFEATLREMLVNRADFRTSTASLLGDVLIY